MGGGGTANGRLAAIVADLLHIRIRGSGGLPVGYGCAVCLRPVRAGAACWRGRAPPLGENAVFCCTSVALRSGFKGVGSGWTVGS